MTPQQSELAQHFYYLDRLRESGETNMYGAGAYLSRDRGLHSAAASRVLVQWMESFSDQDPEVRVQAHFADGPLWGQDGQLRDEHSTALPTPPSEGGAS